MRAGPLRTADRAAGELRAGLGVDRVTAALVLGSGWVSAVPRLGEVAGRVSLGDVTGFRPPTAAGHGHEAILIRAEAAALLVFTGRTHLYEGFGVDAVAHPVRTAAALGARTVVLTNACGSTRPDWEPGTIACLTDHLNLTGATPLSGGDFVDLSQAYDTELRTLAHRVDPNLVDGVYAQFAGPQYETPAEVRMARLLGADLVGMSTALETIAARASGLSVLGLSLITNQAAGVGGDVLDHREVLAMGAAHAARLAALLSGLVPLIANSASEETNR